MVINYGNSIAEFVRKFREYCEYTQADLGKWLGYDSGQYVSNVERGLDRRPVSFCARLMKRLDANRANFLQELLNEAIMEEVDRKVSRKDESKSTRSRKLG